MTQQEKKELIKKLESMVAFQNSCLIYEDWETYDLAENQIKKMENEIVGTI